MAQEPTSRTYYVERLIGHGSVASVWLAHDRDRDARVAVKILAERWSSDANARARFLQQARTLWRLNHARVVGVHATGTLVDGRPYFVMDYADRGSLRQRIDERRQAGLVFSVDEAVAIARELAECLAVIHDLGIFHHSLKPSDVLFRGNTVRQRGADRAGHNDNARRLILLGDFGVARQIEAASGHTISTRAPQYTAPEQEDPASAGQVDLRADLYAASVILFELLAQRVPFPYDSYSELLIAKTTRLAPSIRDLRPDVPPALDAVIARGLSIYPWERYRSAREWSEALRTAITSAPVGDTAQYSVPGARSPDVTAHATLPHWPADRQVDSTRRLEDNGQAIHASNARVTTWPAGVSTRLVATPQSPIRWSRMRVALAAVLVAAVALGSAVTGDRLGSHATPAAPTATPAATATTAAMAPTAAVTVTASPSPAPLTGAEVEERLEPSTVMIAARIDGAGGEPELYTGTGFVYDASGLILTAAHVIEGAGAVEVAFSGDPRPLTASVLGRSTCDDLAVLKVDAPDLTPVDLGDSGTLAVGDDIWALGFPLAERAGEEVSLTSGIVSRLGVDVDIWEDAIQVDAAINAGNSGGPLVNARGEVVGISSAQTRPEYAVGMNYAIPITSARPVIAELARGADPTWLGAELIQNNAEIAAERGLTSGDGMLVTIVTPGGPAAAAGLKPGDVILAMEGVPVRSMGDVCDVVRAQPTGGFPAVELATAEGQPEQQEQPEQSTGSVSIARDDFENGHAGDWDTWDGDGYAVAVDQGRLTFDMREADVSIVNYPTAATSLVDGTIRAEVSLEGDGMAGLMARATMNAAGVWSLYACLISSNGDFGCYRELDGEFTEIVPWQPHGAISIDGANLIVLRVAGNALSFEINGAVVATLTDDGLSRGGAFGTFVQGITPGFTARYDRISIDTAP